MSEKNTLKKKLGLLSMISIASGAVIGGWLAEAPYWFELTGAGSALRTDMCDFKRNWIQLFSLPP